jgi:flagellar hook-associated protein 1 FlgK
MSDIGRVLNTSKDALLSHLTAINITGANIANVNTPGYSRLRPVFSSLGSTGSGTSEIQLGVKVTDAEGIYDQYVDAQLVQQSQEMGYGDARKSSLDRVEGIFNEAGGSGLNEALTKFWNAWEDLSANPSGQVERDALVSVSDNLASMFCQKADQLLDVQQDVNASIADTVTEINSCINDIAQFNDKIVQITNGGGNASDLIDKRQESLKKLGGLIEFNCVQDAGAVTVYLSNGKPLAQSDTAWELDVVVNPGNSSLYDVVFKGNTDEPINDVITKGKLGAYLEVRDTSVAGYLGKLDTLAENLANAVNEQHQLGFDGYGNVGGNFFDPVTEAADMRVAAAITADTGKIAFSGSINSDGANAIEIGRLKDSLLMESGTTTVSSYYSALMGKVGQDVVDAGWNVDRQTVITTQLENQRQTISGVSLDEEMLNLIKYQMGYNAAGKLCGVVGDMMDTLLGLVKE